jgi:hypothetical protein
MKQCHFDTLFGYDLHLEMVHIKRLVSQPNQGFFLGYMQPESTK